MHRGEWDVSEDEQVLNCKQEHSAYVYYVEVCGSVFVWVRPQPEKNKNSQTQTMSKLFP